MKRLEFHHYFIAYLMAAIVVFGYAFEHAPRTKTTGFNGQEVATNYADMFIFSAACAIGWPLYLSVKLQESK